jgi:hypothetical protein
MSRFPREEAQHLGVVRRRRLAGGHPRCRTFEVGGVAGADIASDARGPSCRPEEDFVETLIQRMKGRPEVAASEDDGFPVLVCEPQQDTFAHWIVVVDLPETWRGAQIVKVLIVPERPYTMARRSKDRAANISEG